MEKDFDAWNTKKKQTHHADTSVLFYEREVWWTHVGVNVGVEIDGRHELFLRPVVIVRKFNKNMALVVPTTAKDKDGKYYFAVSGEDKKRYITCVSQLKNISAKRLYRKIGTISVRDYQGLVEHLSRMIKGEFKNDDAASCDAASRRPKPIITGKYSKRRI